MKLRKNMNQEERKSRAIVILSIYGVFFLILMFLMLGTDEKDRTKKGSIYPISKRFSDYVGDENYKYEFNINNNLILNGERSRDKFYIIKNYNNSLSYNYINNGNYYIKTDGNYVKVNDLRLYEGYDKTILENNIISYILRNSRKDNEGFSIGLDEVLELYNNVNLTKYSDKDNLFITGSFNYEDNSIMVSMDLSNYYKVIFNYNGSVIYKLRYFDKGKVRLNIDLMGEDNE